MFRKFFPRKSNPDNAFAMAKYMQNQFPFFGIKTDDRRSIFKTICKEYKQEVAKIQEQLLGNFF
jgi:3-methyladenine DNA glycosylase AlkD